LISLELTENSKTFYRIIVRVSWPNKSTCNIEKDRKLKTRLNTMELSRRRRGRTNLMGSEPIRWWEEFPSQTLQVDRRRVEIVGESSGSPSTGGKKNKQWSENIFGFTSYTTEPGTSNMSHGWIRHIRWFETWQFIIEIELHIISVLIHIL
jgi:hypothetical protein